MKSWIGNIQWKFSAGAATLSSRLKQLEFIWYEELDISNKLRAYCQHKMLNKDCPARTNAE